METRISQHPESEPISIEDAQQYLLLDADIAADDTQIVESLITAARQYCEHYCDRALVKQAYITTFDRFIDGIYLPGGNVINVLSFSYLNEMREKTEVDPAIYSVSAKGRLRLNPHDSWPRHEDIPNSIQIEYTTGYEQVPQDIIQAMRLLITSFYENRSEVVVGASTGRIPFGVHALLSRHRIVGV